MTTKNINPSVNRYNGKDKNATMGRTTSLTTPKMSATTTKMMIRSPSEVRRDADAGEHPGRNREPAGVRHNPNQPGDHESIVP